MSGTVVDSTFDAIQPVTVIKLADWFCSRIVSQVMPGINLGSKDRTEFNISSVLIPSRYERSRTRHRTGRVFPVFMLMPMFFFFKGLREWIQGLDLPTFSLQGSEQTRDNLCWPPVRWARSTVAPAMGHYCSLQVKLAQTPTSSFRYLSRRRPQLSSHFDRVRHLAVARSNVKKPNLPVGDWLVLCISASLLVRTPSARARWVTSMSTKTLIK